MKYHPDIELLLKYTSGKLEPSLALAVGLHHKHCKICQERVAELEIVGGETLESMPTVADNEDQIVLKDFDKLLGAIDQIQPVATISEYEDLAVAESDFDIVDKLVKQDFDDMEWRRVSPKIWKSTIAMNDADFEVELLKFAANAKIPQHTHEGDEYTVVLQGDFSDSQGHYKAGSFIVQDENDEHSPVAGENGCICLAITNAPLKFTGTLGPILNWFSH
ncbi:anti-sigma factor [Aliikangiella marina]|uniref:Anti-sigma factor n=1 Tax=Aliikangiella marina TaxID=1712262 RepID=A0A545T8P8_9GAMM|nr:ChrR family anti-sigma-E factor [Aliikangiella marina]TQV73586.1 anti-sigma factor [Aliikangiella marina]